MAKKKAVVGNFKTALRDFYNQFRKVIMDRFPRFPQFPQFQKPIEDRYEDLKRAEAAEKEAKEQQAKS